MTRYFKIPSIIFFATWAAAALCCVGYIIFGSPQYYMIAVIGCIVVSVAAMFIANKMAMNDFNALLDILNEQCDADRFIEEFSDIAEKAEKIKKINGSSAQLKVNLRTTYAVALSAAGRHDEACGIVDALSALECRKSFAAAKISMLTNSAIIHTLRGAEGDRATARDYIEKARELLPMANTYASIGLKSHIERTEKVMDLRTGRRVLQQEYFEQALAKADTMREKVMMHQYLAEISQRSGKAEERWQHLRFVCKFGGTMQTSRKAREVLEAENQLEPPAAAN